MLRMHVWLFQNAIYVLPCVRVRVGGERREANRGEREMGRGGRGGQNGGLYTMANTRDTMLRISRRFMSLFGREEQCILFYTEIYIVLPPPPSLSLVWWSCSGNGLFILWRAFLTRIHYLAVCLCVCLYYSFKGNFHHGAFSWLMAATRC